MGDNDFDRPDDVDEKHHRVEAGDGGAGEIAQSKGGHPDSRDHNEQQQQKAVVAARTQSGISLIGARLGITTAPGTS